MNKLGFTGNRQGMTQEQRRAFWHLVASLNPNEFHHGDCIGSDEQAHEMVRRISQIPNRKRIHTVGHIPLNEKSRAFCRVDERREPYEYLERNQHIVDEGEALIAAPSDFIEVQRSGTWATIRMARKANKPIYIIRPDGSILEENLG